MVDPGCLRPKNAVYQADRIDGMEVRVVVALLELAGVEFAAVKDDALHQARKNRQLHLDVVDRPRAIDRLDVQNRQFVVLEILQVEGIFEGDLDDRRLRLENRVEQTDQGDAVLRGPKGFLEGKIIDGANSKRHGGRRQWVNALRGSLVPLHYTRSAAYGHEQQAFRAGP